MEWLVLLVIWMSALAIGGAVIELVIERKSRRWVRRLRGLEAGREAQRRGG